MSTTTWRAAGAALVAVALAAGMVGAWACGDDDGSGRNPDAGDGDSGREDSGVPGSAWIGRWVYISGTSTAECVGQPARTSELEAEFEITKVADEFEVREGDCVVRFMGDEARIEALPNQHCVSASNNGATGEIQFNSYVFEKTSSDEFRASLQSLTTLHIAGGSITCDSHFAGGVAQRVPNL